MNELKKVEPLMVVNAANIHHLGTHVYWASALLAPCQVWVWGGAMENPGAHRQPPDPAQWGEQLRTVPNRLPAILSTPQKVP